MTSVRGDKISSVNNNEVSSLDSDTISYFDKLYFVPDQWYCYILPLDKGWAAHFVQTVLSGGWSITGEVWRTPWWPEWPVLTAVSYSARNGDFTIHIIRLVLIITIHDHHQNPYHKASPWLLNDDVNAPGCQDRVGCNYFAWVSSQHDVAG